MESNQQEDRDCVGNDNYQYNIESEWTIIWIIKTVIHTYNYIENAKRDPAISQLIDNYMNTLLTTGWSIFISSSLFTVPIGWIAVFLYQKVDSEYFYILLVIRTLVMVSLYKFSKVE